MSKKPPIGLKPREINDENRFANVREAMVRYLNSGLVIPHYVVQSGLDERTFNATYNGRPLLFEKKSTAEQVLNKLREIRRNQVATAKKNKKKVGIK